MKNIAAVSTDQQQEGEEHPLIRGTYALGVSILLFGAVLPHSATWMSLGIAMIVFSILF
jgi:hypothetical protein